MIFYLFYLNLNPMTLLLKINLDIVQMNCILKLKFLAVAVQKLKPLQINTEPHTETRLKLLVTSRNIGRVLIFD